MRLAARWGAAPASAFVSAWWVCQKLIRVDEGAGIVGAVLTAALAVAGWWAALGTGSGESDGVARRLVQKARVHRDVSIAGGPSSSVAAGMNDR
jgi:hypothetical protein